MTKKADISTGGMSGALESEIAAALNARSVVTDFGRAWTRGAVHQVLTNEKYIGNNVYHRTSFKLKRRHVANPPQKWIRADGAFAGIVDPEIFLKAREIILARSRSTPMTKCWNYCGPCSASTARSAAS